MHCSKNADYFCSEKSTENDEQPLLGISYSFEAEILDREEGNFVLRMQAQKH